MTYSDVWVARPISDILWTTCSLFESPNDLQEWINYCNYLIVHMDVSINITYFSKITTKTVVHPFCLSDIKTKFIGLQPVFDI